MKDLSESPLYSGIEIYQYRTKRVLGLSQKAYIEKILIRYDVDAATAKPFVKGDKLFQCPNNRLELDEIDIPYALVVKNLM
jgi:hypothetical protein